MTQELQYLGQSKPVFTTVFLHNKVLNRLKKSWNPRFAPSEQQERRRTPIYIHLGDDRKQRCIELGPPRRLASHTYAATPGLRSEPSADSSAPSTSQSETEDIDMLGLEDISQSSVGSNGQDLTSPQVLISVALEDEQVLHSRDWLDWLKEFPAIARSVHIEGVYKSDSTLLHLSLPVAIWDAIPRNPAISFLAFIRTNNLVRFRESRDLPSHTAQTRSHSHSGAIKAADGLQSLLVINRATIEVITAALIPFTAANDPLSGLSQYLNRSSQWAFASAYNPTGWWTGVSINANCTAALVFDLGPSQDKTASKSLPYSTSFTDPAPYQSSSKDGGWPKIKCPFERAESHPSPRCTAEFVSFVELYEHLFKVHSNVKQRPKRIQRVSNVEKMGSRAGDIQRD